LILRRFSTAVREQDWFTVTVEILIVVIGVFIGLQVNNWNEARLEQRQSADFTERLIADLRIEAWNYDVMLGYLGDVQRNADKALAVLEGSSEASNEDLMVYAYRATQYTDGTRRRATYDELTSTGKIGLIRDPFLRDTAASVYTRVFIDRVTEEGTFAPYRIAFRKLIPLVVQEELAENCGDRFVPVGDYNAIPGQLDYECATALTTEQIEQAANLLRTDPDIVSLLRLLAVNLRTHISLFNFANQDIMNSLHAIAAEAP
jgi:hypothetical protein